MMQQSAMPLDQSYYASQLGPAQPGQVHPPPPPPVGAAALGQNSQAAIGGGAPVARTNPGMLNAPPSGGGLLNAGPSSVQSAPGNMGTYAGAGQAPGLTQGGFTGTNALGGYGNIPENTVGNYGTVNASALAANGASNAAGYDLNQSTLMNGGKGYSAPMLSLTQPYGDYQNFGAIADQYGQSAGQALNDPNVAAGLGGLGQAAGGQLQGQQTAAQGAALLGQAAAGNTPSAAQVQMQQGNNAAIANAQAQAASTRGNLGLAMAQKNAMGTAATLGQQNVSNTSALRAQEMATAQQGYAQAGAGLANNQLQGASAFGNAAMANENTNVNYGLTEQGDYMNQSGQALGAATTQENAYLGQGTQNLGWAQLDQQNDQYNTNRMDSALDKIASAGGGAAGAAAL